MLTEVRKYVAFVEDTLIEGTKLTGTPFRMAAVAAALKTRV